MAESSKPVDPSSVDAVAQTNALVLGLAPAVSVANAYQTLANAATMAAYNAVHAQQQAWIAHQAATDEAVAKLLSMIK